VKSLTSTRINSASRRRHTLRHAFITAALDAGVPLCDVQEAASHADPRTTMRYDRARGSLDRHATSLSPPTWPEPPGKRRLTASRPRLAGSSGQAESGHQPWYVTDRDPDRDHDPPDWGGDA